MSNVVKNIDYLGQARSRLTSVFKGQYTFGPSYKLVDTGSTGKVLFTGNPLVKTTQRLLVRIDTAGENNTCIWSYSHNGGTTWGTAGVPQVSQVITPTITATLVNGTPNSFVVGTIYECDTFVQGRIDGFIQAWSAEFQEIENAFYDILTKRLLQSSDFSNADDLLDKLGKIVIESRNGYVNADYLLFIKAKIATNDSDGKRETLIKIANLLMPGNVFIVREFEVGGAIVIEATLPFTAPANVVGQQFLIPAAAGGIRLYFVYSAFDYAHTFKFAWTGGSVGEVATQGFGWTGNAALGGHFAGTFAGRG